MVAVALACVWMAVFWLCGPDTFGVSSSAGAILVHVALHLVMFFALAASLCAAAMWVAVVAAPGRKREFGAWPPGVLAGAAVVMVVLMVAAVGLAVGSLWFFWMQPLYLCVVGVGMAIVVVCTAVSGAVVLKRLADSSTLQTNRVGADRRRRVVARKVLLMGASCVLFLVAVVVFFLTSSRLTPSPELLFGVQFGCNVTLVSASLVFVWLFRIFREDSAVITGGSSPRQTTDEKDGRRTPEEQWEQSIVALS
jgi:hypothetical protein